MKIETVSTEQLDKLEQERSALSIAIAEKGERIKQLEERIGTASSLEPAYRQLKAQFEEKNRVLHKTRVELFQADAALQAKKLEESLAAMQDAPEINRMAQDMSRLTEELELLEAENRELTALISAVIGNSMAAPSAVKKKTEEVADPV